MPRGDRGLNGKVRGLVILVVPDLPEVVQHLAVLAGERPSLCGAVPILRLNPAEVRLDLVLHVARVRHACQVLARNVWEIVDARWHLQAILFEDVAVLDDLERAPRGHGGELLERLAVPAADVHVRHGDEAPGNVRVAGGAVDALPAHVVEAQDGPHHVHEAPNLLDGLALGKVLDDHAVLQGHEANLIAAAILRLVFPCNLLDEVRRCNHRRLPRVERLPPFVGLWARWVNVQVRQGRERRFHLRSEIFAQEAPEHAQQNDASEVAVLRLLVPPVQLGVVQPEGQGGVACIPRQRVEEPRPRRQHVDKLALERHGPAQLQRLLQDLLAHALELQPREVPDLCHLVLSKVLLDRRELPDSETEGYHPVLVHLGQGKLCRRHQVDYDLVI
mmetsp:Transcript_32090/g.92086  ORF Transcript_32090/g.92086 Transcript_32090/m.92086 type:complete len:389 (-) Transcript_32090:689-1855(-)